MSPSLVDESAILDLLDKQIIHAVIVDARIPFAKLGAILGVSEQTVARRYRSLRERGIVHVTGQVNAVPLGYTRWVLRIRSTPAHVVQLAEALARVPDLSWVTIMSANSEIMCICRPRSKDRRDALLLRIIPQTSQVVGLDAYDLIHRFPLIEEWPAYQHLFTESQLRELGPRRAVDDIGPDAPVDLSREDEIMLELLANDGRASYAQIATATGWPAARAARRMNELTASNVLYFDLDFAVERMGYHTRAVLWIGVQPAFLDAAGRAAATHPEVVFVSATTGVTNLYVTLLCRDAADLYRYVTERLGTIEGVERVEVSHALRALKQAHAIMDTGLIKFT